MPRRGAPNCILRVELCAAICAAKSTHMRARADFAGDMPAIAADPETQRWWKETDPCQIPLPDASSAGRIWSDAEEIFYTNEA